MDLSFCDRCDGSIPGGDLDRGRAGKVGDRLLCARCRRIVRLERALRVALGGLCLLAAAAAGAAGAVGILAPRVETLEKQVAGLTGDLRTALRGDPGLADELDALRELSRRQADRIEGLTRAIDENFRRIRSALEPWPDQAKRFSEEIAKLKTYVAGLSKEPPPVSDLELWLGMVTDPDSGARITALRKLAAFDDERVGRRALVALEDPDPRVRFEAALLLGDRKDRRAVPKLLDMLTDDSDLARYAAHRALLAISGEHIPFEPTQPPEIRAAGVKAWRDWWKKQ